MTTITPFITDIIIVAVLLFSAIIAFVRGFVKEVLTIFSLVGAALGAFLWGPELSPMMKNMTESLAEGDKNLVWGLIPHEIFVMVLSYGLVFVLVFIVFSVLSHFIGKAVQGVGLGAVDRTLGFVFGIARGLIILALINVPVMALLGNSDRPAWLKDAKTMILVDKTSHAIMELDPSSLVGKEDKKVIRIEKSEDELKIKTEPNRPQETGSGYTETERDTLDSLIEQVE